MPRRQHPSCVMIAMPPTQTPTLTGLILRDRDQLQGVSTVGELRSPHPGPQLTIKPQAISARYCSHAEAQLVRPCRIRRGRRLLRGHSADNEAARIASRLPTSANKTPTINSKERTRRCGGPEAAAISPAAHSSRPVRSLIVAPHIEGTALASSRARARSSLPAYQTRPDSPTLSECSGLPADHDAFALRQPASPRRIYASTGSDPLWRCFSCRATNSITPSATILRAGRQHAVMY